MKRLTASFACLLTAVLVAATTAIAADEPAAKPALTAPPAATSMAAEANKTFLLIRKRVMLQKEITALEARTRNNPGTAELRRELLEIEAKISELQNKKRSLIMAAEPKLQELYRQLGEISAEIATSPAAATPKKP